MSADSFCQAVEKEMKKLPAGVSDFDSPSVSAAWNFRKVNVEEERPGNVLVKWRKLQGKQQEGFKWGGAKGGTKTPFDNLLKMVLEFSWPTDSAQPPFQPALPRPGRRRRHWDETHGCTYLPSETFVSLQQKHLLSCLTKEDKLWACAGKDWIKNLRNNSNTTGGQFTPLPLRQSLMQSELYGRFIIFMWLL